MTIVATHTPTSSSSFTVHRGGQPRETRILIVDDEETIRLALGKFFRGRGYEVEAVDAGPLAMERLRAELGKSPFMLMLCDVRMPGMSGLEILPAALGIDPDLAILMLTAVNDAPTATEALTLGAYDYLMKPIELAALHQAVERALHKRELQIEQRNVERMIRDEVAQRTEELEREKLALRMLTVSIAETLINAMEAKDLYLRGHSQRVAELAASIADHLGLDEDTVEAVRLAGKLADVGKIGIREEVLNKPGSLTPEELEHIRSHVQIGMEILAPLKHLGSVLEFVQDHHEHVNGKGYPRGLAGGDISLGGRILTACDAYDALTSKRAYRGAMTAEDTLAHLGKYVDMMLDERIYEALCTVVRRKRTLVFIED